ncbi:unnamed protein product [Durusdinium trenchii]|uniref:Uncharacterized protein n=2 Tax=Durusdinium trenchii TaxID=1381693 RepID=A0ABP0M352_9DINO
MQQPPPQSLIGSSSASRPPTQVKAPTVTVTVTEADRVAWMRRFLVALELWKKCLDSASSTSQGSTQVGQKRAHGSQEEPSKRPKEAKKGGREDSAKDELAIVS